MRFGIIVNTSKAEAVALGRDLYQWGKQRGKEIYLFRGEDLPMGLAGEGIPLEEWLSAVDTAIVIGGDGTFIRAAHLVMRRKIALFGICQGHLGFMAVGSPDFAKEEIEQIEAGEAKLEWRGFLRGAVISLREERCVYALNDIVLNKYQSMSLVAMDLKVNGRTVCEYRADGMIIATASGSTAYALSAGGPIIAPDIPCMLSVPICAHTLCVRPTIFSPNDMITLAPIEGSQVYATVDGDERFPLMDGDSIDITLSQQHGLYIYTLPQRSYYDLLHKKFYWGWNAISERNATKNA